MMERVSDEWIDAFFDDDKYGMIMCGVFAKNVILCMKELQARRKAEKEHGHTDNSASEKGGAGATQEKPVLPIHAPRDTRNGRLSNGLRKSMRNWMK